MDYEPDPLVMCQDEMYSADNLIELAPGVPGGRNDLDDNNARGGGRLWNAQQQHTTVTNFHDLTLHTDGPLEGTILAP